MSASSTRWAERACRGLIAAAAVLVPYDRRAEWKEEWEAEVWHELHGFGARRRALAGLGAVVRCLGAFAHAFWIRRERWSMNAVWTKLRLSARRLARDPAFTVPAVLVFGLAVAATATLFSSYEAVVLRSPTFARPSRLVSVWAENEELGWYQEYVAPANFMDWREEVDAFDDVAAYGDYSNEQILLVDGQAEVVEAGQVTGNLFDVLGVAPALGRAFRMSETWSDSDPVVVLSHDFWQRRFGSDPEAVGADLELSGVVYEVIGVMPADFRYLAPDKDLWMTFRWAPEARAAAFFRRAHLVRTVARLADGVTADEATEQLRAVAARLADGYPATNEGLTAGVTPLADYLVGDRKTTLRALLGGVGVLLIAACLNVGYLVIVRWKRRYREVAIRRALGAGTGAITGDAALESILLSLVGAGLGVLGSLLGMRLLGALAPPELLASVELRVSGPLLLLATGVMALAALLFTVLPMRTNRAVRAAEVATSGTRSAVSTGRARGIHAFVVLQVALSTVLIFSAVLLARSFVALRSVEPGFNPTGVLTFAVPFPDQSDEAGPERVRTARQIERDLAGVQGVVSVGAVRRLPVTGNGWTSLFSVEGRAPGEGSFEIVHREADRGYFDAMQVHLVRGRLFDDDEKGGLVVNEAFARRAFGDDEAIGRRIAFTGQPSERSTWWRIVGVVAGERQNGLRAAIRPEVFEHYSFDVPATFRFVVRTSSDPTAMIDRAREILRGVDPGLPMDEVATLDDIVSTSLARDRFVTTVAGAFALLAGLLAVVGVYGVTAQVAAGWQREFAVRLAVGARPRNLFASVLGRGAALVGGGLLFGSILAVWAARFVDAFLFETSASDPSVLVGSALLVGLSGLAAAVPSAVRAMRTDPARSLAAT